MKKNRFYSFIILVLRPFFYLFHPYRVIWNGEIPAGGALICANHYSPSDPFFIAFGLAKKAQVRVMAKGELMRVPVIGWLVKKAGVFGVSRGKSDVKAIKEAMRALKNGEKVLLFPEGTRNKKDEDLAKTGAAMLAMRTGVPIVPIWMRPKKFWFFRRTPVVVGTPYHPQFEGDKPTSEDYDRAAQELMARIFKLEEAAQ